MLTTQAFINNSNMMNKAVIQVARGPLMKRRMMTAIQPSSSVLPSLTIRGDMLMIGSSSRTGRLQHHHSARQILAATRTIGGGGVHYHRQLSSLLASGGGGYKNSSSSSSLGERRYRMQWYRSLSTSGGNLKTPTPSSPPEGR